MRLLKFGVVYVVFASLTFIANHSYGAGTASNWVDTDQSRIRLISGSEGLKGRDSLRIGLQIQLAPGWKTYWRSPGDAGIPPQLDWTGSENLKSAKILWPLPEEFEAYGFSSWGYHDEIVFPIDISLKEEGKPLDLKLQVQLGICENVCIPYAFELALSVDAIASMPSEEAGIIEQYFLRVPDEIGVDDAVLTDVDAKSADDRRFTVQVSATQQLNEPSIIVEGKEGAYFDLLSTVLSMDRKQAIFELEGHLPAKSDQLSGQSITVTVFDKDISGEKHLRID
jgi:suppressor for copper-sensitivity B